MGGPPVRPRATLRRDAARSPHATTDQPDREAVVVLFRAGMTEKDFYWGRGPR